MIKRLQDSARSENNYPAMNRLNETNGSITVNQLVETPTLNKYDRLGQIIDQKVKQTSHFGKRSLTNEP